MNLFDAPEEYEGGQKGGVQKWKTLSNCQKEKKGRMNLLHLKHSHWDFLSVVYIHKEPKIVILHL